MNVGGFERSLRFLTKLKKLIGRPVDSIRMYEGELGTAPAPARLPTLFLRLSPVPLTLSHLDFAADIDSTNRGIEALEAAGVTCVRFAAGGRKESVFSFRSPMESY